MVKGAEDAERDELLERLAAIAGALDAPPPELASAAQAAFGWRTIDAELAELVYDSWLDDGALAGVRTDTGPRRLTFDAPDMTMEVQIDITDGGTCQLVGHVFPPRAGVVEVRNAERSLAVPVDQLGRFTINRLPAGHLSLQWRAEGTSTVDTAWVVAW